MGGEADLKINVTADAKQATGEMGQLDDVVGKTGGGMTALAGGAAVGAAALVALGTKSIMAFQDLGLTVGKFSAATGISAEESSRLIEVAGDLGIGTDQLQGGILKMSKALGPAGDGLKQYGVEVVKNADGTTNLSETFVGAVGAINGIQDPLKRTEAQTKIFGKGFANMAELTGLSAEDLKASLAGVSDAKIFDDEKINKAKDLRSGFDAISDAGEDLFLTIGNALAPVVATLAAKLGEVIQKAAPLAEVIGELLVAALELVAPLLDVILAVLGPVIEGLSKLAGVVTNVASGIHDALTQNVEGELGFSLEEVAGSAKTAEDATADLAEQEEIAKASAEAQAEANKELEKKLKATEAALKADLKAQEELSEAFEIASDTSYALADAQDTYAETVAGLDQAVVDAAGNQTTINRLYRDATMDAAAVAKATVELAANQAEMNGTTLTAAERLDLMNGSMVTAGASATGPLKQSIIDYIATTNGIPASKMTDIQAAIDAGDLETANRLLTEASAARTVAVKADADGTSIRQVGKALDDITRDRIAKVGVSLGGGMKAFAKGGTVTGDDEVLVGEDGPEIAKLPAGTHVTTAPESRARLRDRGGSGGTTYVDQSTTIVNMPSGVNIRDLTRAEDLRSRLGKNR